MPKVPADSDDVPAEWRTSGVPGDVARLSLLAEAIEEYIAASQVCEAAQDDLPYTSPTPPLYLPTSPRYLPDISPISPYISAGSSAGCSAGGAASG